MIFKPAPEVMMSFRALRGNVNFERILDFLLECKTRTDDEGRQELNEVKLRWNQGSTKTIDEILRLYSESKQMK